MKVIHMFVVVINSSASSQLATSVACVQYDFGKPHIPCLCLNESYEEVCTKNRNLGQLQKTN